MSEGPSRRIYLKEFKAISHAISTYEDLVMLTNHLVEGICTSFKVKGCAILLYDDREQELVCVSSYGVSDSFRKKGPIRADGKHGAFTTGEPVFIEDVLNDPRVQYPEETAAEGIKAMLSVPIKARKKVVGVVRIYNDDPWVLHPEDQDSFCMFGRQLGLVIEFNGLMNFLDIVKTAMGSLPLRLL